MSILSKSTVVIITAGILTGCTSEPPDTRSIKDMDYAGPSALCTDVKAVLKNPPPDMTKRQKLEAKLSQDACRLPSEDITADTVLAKLDGDTITYDIDKNVITVYSLSEHETDRLCCSLQPSLLPVAKTEDGNLFAGRYQLKDLDAARLEFFRPDFSGKPLLYKGPSALGDISFNEGELSGKLTEGVLDSKALEEKRGYLIYTPPGFKKGDDVPIVMLGDGRSLGFHIRQWEPLMLDGKTIPFVGIGIKSGEEAVIDPQKQYDFDVRNADYIHNYKNGPQRFDQHLKFVTDELLEEVAKELGLTPRPETTVLMGGSSGGSFALWGVMKRPDVFGYSVGTSPSGPIPETISELAATRRYFTSAGIYEPGFLANAILYKEVLEASGATVDIAAYPDGHSVDHRARRMVDVLPILFPPE